MAKVDAARLTREVNRLERVELARNQQMSRVWDFLNNLRESTSCEETKEKIRSFIQQDDLLEREKAA